MLRQSKTNWKYYLMYFKINILSPNSSVVYLFVWQTDDDLSWNLNVQLFLKLVFWWRKINKQKNEGLPGILINPFLKFCNIWKILRNYNATVTNLKWTGNGKNVQWYKIYRIPIPTIHPPSGNAKGWEGRDITPRQNPSAKNTSSRIKKKKLLFTQCVFTVPWLSGILKTLYLF